MKATRRFSSKISARSFGFLAVSLAGVSSNAWAISDHSVNLNFGSGLDAVSKTELIVRFRAPQEDEHQAALSALEALTQRWGSLEKLTEAELMEVAEGEGLSASRTEVVNAEEGVVKLEFSTPGESAAALAKLRKSDQVLGVTPNLFYTPALHLSLREAEESQGEKRGSLLLPFFSSWDFGLGALRGRTGTGIPDVILPPGQSGGTGVDPLASSDWAVTKIGLPSSLPSAAKSQSIVTAVIDTGVDYNHEDLIGAMWRKPGNPQEVGYDFVHNTPKAYDVVKFDVEGCMNDFGCSMGMGRTRFLVNPGHGTHCAGHVGAVANNKLGIYGVGGGVSGAAQAQVMALKFFYDAGEKNAGRGSDAGAVKSIDYAIKNGVKVINASWGGRIPRETAQDSEVKKALIRAKNAGVLVVVAAGNDGINQDEVENPAFPAAYSDLDNLIVVAAINSNDELASFSNYGAKSVHIGAPGVKILSTTVGSKYSDSIAKFRDSEGKNREMSWDGTSMAAPMVAGAAALIWSFHPNETYQQIRDRILRSARPVPALAGKVVTGGALDIAGALR